MQSNEPGVMHCAATTPVENVRLCGRSELPIGATDVLTPTSSPATAGMGALTVVVELDGTSWEDSRARLLVLPP